MHMRECAHGCVWCVCVYVCVCVCVPCVRYEGLGDYVTGGSYIVPERRAGSIGDNVATMGNPCVCVCVCVCVSVCVDSIIQSRPRVTAKSP